MCSRSSGRWSNKQVSPHPQRPYQGSLQEEYGGHTPGLVGYQPPVPAAATEPACGLRVQMELGVEGAVLPALLSLLREVLLQGRMRGLRVVLLSCVPAGCLPPASPPAGRRWPPAPGSASGDSESALAPSVAGGRNGRSFPPSSRSGACRRVGSPLHTPSLQGQHRDLWVHLNLQAWGALTCLRKGP